MTGVATRHKHFGHGPKLAKDVQHRLETLYRTGKLRDVVSPLASRRAGADFQPCTSGPDLWQAPPSLRMQTGLGHLACLSRLQARPSLSVFVRYMFVRRRPADSGLQVPGGSA